VIYLTTEAGRFLKTTRGIDNSLFPNPQGLKIIKNKNFRVKIPWGLNLRTKIKPLGGH